MLRTNIYPGITAMLFGPEAKSSLGQVPVTRLARVGGNCKMRNYCICGVAAKFMRSHLEDTRTLSSKL